MNNFHILVFLIYTDIIKEKQVEKLCILNEWWSKQFKTKNNAVSPVYNKEVHDKAR